MTLPRSLENCIPAYGRRPLLAAIALQSVVYWGTKLITGAWPHRIMATALDDAFPLLPWMTVVYFGSYLFWVVNYILAVRQGEENAWRFLAADTLGKQVCMIFFLAIPTTVVRPAVPENAPFGWLLALLYAADVPDNLFPSIHCFNSWLCWAGIRGRKGVSAGYRAFSLIATLLIGVSTLATKQHVVVDVVTGFALAELCWLLAGHTKLAALYGAAAGKARAGASQ